MVYCGIDVGKHDHHVCLLDEHGQRLQPDFAIANDRPGFDRLLQVLTPYAEQVHLGLEATGHYWLALYDMLTRAAYAVVVFNPLQVRAYRKVDLRKRKTDRVDAYWIADFLRFSHTAVRAAEVPLLVQLRELSRFRFRLVQQIGDAKRKIISILDRVFPEYERLFSDVFLQSSRRLLAEAVTAEEFAALDLSELVAQLQRVSRGHFGPAKAAEIQRVARHSVGVSFLTDAVHVEMQCLLAQMTLLEEQVQAVEGHLEILMAQLEQHLTTIPGIGLVSGAMLLAEIGDVQRFESLEKLVAYAGLDATVYRSGQFEGDRRHMSKRGSPYLRYALWQAAAAALLHNAELKAFYDKKRAEGKPHGVALGAVCRKLLGRVYVILRERRPYVVR